MHRTPLIKLEPEVVELVGGTPHQPAEAVLRVTNVSASVLPGLFFCLYNQEKFDIVPENFSLQPSECKTVTVRMKLEAEKRTAHKEYAYLKSSVVSKRITILVGQQDGDAAVTTSRMTDQQIEASMAASFPSQRNFELGQGRTPFQPPRIEQSRFTATGFEQELEHFNISTGTRQLSQAEAEILELKRKLRTFQNENERLRQQLQCTKKQLDQQSNQANYKTLYEKQKVLYCQLKEQLQKIYSQRNVVDVRRKDAEAQLHHRDMRIKHLQHQNTQLTLKLVDAEAEGSDLKGKHIKSSKQLILRQEQLKHIRGELLALKQAIDTFEGQRVNYIKVQFENGKLLQSNSSLQQQVEKLQSILNQQQQELVKVQAIRQHTEQSREGVDKAREYLSLALESSKIEAETLRMNKQEVERAMQQLIDTEKELAVKLRSKDAQLQQLQRQRLAVNDQLLSLNGQNSQLRQQLLELQTLKAEHSILKKKQLSTEHKLLTMENQLQEAHQDRDETISKLKQSEAEQLRYRTDVTRQLDIIKNSTIKEMTKLSHTKAKRRRNQDTLETATKEGDATQPKNSMISPRTYQTVNSAAKIKEVQSIEQQQPSSRNRIRSRSGHHLDRRLDEQLVEVLKVFEIEQRKVCDLLQLHDEPVQSPMLKLLSFFRQLQYKLTELTTTHKQQSEYLDEIRKLKFELIDKEAALKAVPTNNTPKPAQPDTEKHEKLLEFIQEEMRKQFSRMQTSLTFSNEKHEILKRKVYNEYRFRIVTLLNGKTTDARKLEALLERFIEGLSNLSHKEAQLQRNSKKHQQSVKQNKALKHRINELDWLLGEKTTAACTRSPVKVFGAATTSNENMLEGLRCQAQLLSCKSQLNQVSEQLACTAQTLNTANQQIAHLGETIQRKDEEILRAKTQFLELERLHKSELVDALDEMESLRIHSLRVNELEEQLASQIEKSKGALTLKQDLNKKRELIKGLKDREKSLVQIIEDIRQHIEQQEKSKADKVKSKEEARLQELVADFRERNKQLKSELEKRVEAEKKLQDELDRKNNQISSLKTTIGIKERQLKDQEREDTSKFKSAKKQLEAELRDIKGSSGKAQRQLQSFKKHCTQLESELVTCKESNARLTDEVVVKQKSLMSTIRSLVEILRRVWRSIEIKVRKVRHNATPGNFQAIVADPLRIDILRLYDQFEGMLDTLRQSVSTN